MTTFTPLTIQRLATHPAGEVNADRRWLLLLEFLEEYRHEPVTRHRSLRRRRADHDQPQPIAGRTPPAYVDLIWFDL